MDKYKLIPGLSALVALSILALFFVACSSTPAAQPTAEPPAASTPVPQPTAQPTTAAATYTDPFAYCAAVGTADAPGPEYTGPKLPDNVAEAIKKASGASPDMPIDILKQGSFWRCMNGKVYGCFVGANLPCDSKANVDKTPTAEEADFCKANPNADVIPAVVTGHETVYEWRCNNDAPEIVKQVAQVDARGYMTDIWYQLSP